MACRQCIVKQRVYLTIATLISLSILQAEFINPSYYQDAVEERAIGKQCGFSLCSNRLEKVWKQQYCIHLSSKKVFDVTHRKVHEL